MKKYIAIILFVFTACTVYGQVRIESALDTTKIRIGEQAVLRIRVNTDKQAKVIFPSFKPQQQLTDGVEVVEISCDTLDDSGQSISCSYTLTSFDEANYTLPALNVKVDGKSYTTRPMTLQVETVAVDTANTEEMMPAYDVVDNPFLWTEWILPCCLFLLALLLCGLICILAKRLRSNKPIRFRSRFVKKVLPHEKALAAIDTLSATSRQSAEEQKDYYTKLTDVLRQYLEDRFGINAMEMTTSEIVSRLQQEEDQSKIAELKEVFETADLVKFAKYSTHSNESDFYLTSVVQFIKDTKQEVASEFEEVEAVLSDDDKRLIRTRRILKILIGMAVIAIIALLIYVVMLVYELLK